MSTITLNVEGSTVGTLTVTTVLTPAQSDRLMAYLVAEFGTGQDADGNPVPRTSQEMVTAYWASIVSGTLNNVVRFEQAQAERAARNAVQPFAL